MPYKDPAYQAKWRAAHRDELKAYRRLHYVANRDAYVARACAWQRDNRERKREYDKARRERLRDDLRAKNLAYKEAHREEIRLAAKAYYAANREQISLTIKLRGKRKRAAMIGEVTVELLEAKLAYWGGKCWMCDGPFEHWDHVKPLSKGGAHCLANLRPACAPCNMHKHATWPFRVAA